MVHQETECRCTEIMKADVTRHFRGCPLRENYPTHEAEHVCTLNNCGHMRQLDDIVNLLGMPRGGISVLDYIRGFGETVMKERIKALEAFKTGAQVNASVEGWEHTSRPRIVCLCGSTRFTEAFRKANLDETLAGRIVLTVGCDTKSDDILGLDPGVKERLDILHKKKIDLADEVLVLNVEACEFGKHTREDVERDPRGYLHEGHLYAPYIGSSTKSEIKHALKMGKTIRFLNPQGPENTEALSSGGQPYGYGDVAVMMRRLGLE